MGTITKLVRLLGIFFSFSSHGAISGVDVVSASRIAVQESSTKATVYVFLSARCPCSSGHEGALKALHREFSQKGFQFIGIHSNQNESPEETRRHFLASGLPFPVIEDEGWKIANEFRALKTPHVFVRRGSESLFEGGVDDTASGTGSKRHYLRDALREIDSGLPVTHSRARVLGCTISRSKT
ncbi:MAG: redoxin domain-containing protein [Bdellovibrionales bacterium]|nr:redoxin domain-containing protein [Bdellovibrionales bacterium]